ncbi:PREDICTED: enkurin [Dinoponera quadriceps]|uniref:Enkurin n=1 Tax=Dinoponera quadriceps TaxID=609295 RepID=A0A6P3XS85_DINQU|nr:PREDICTED: enkurin [Dinoponera quadriceps]
MADLPEELVVAGGKDFIQQNILHVQRSSPKEPKQRSVDTRRGDTRDLKYSGLIPIYVHKKNYGKVPRFIAADARAAAMGVETTERRDLDEDKMPEIPSCRYIDKEERKALLDGMKDKWGDLMEQFQRLPLNVAVAHVQKRKSRLERELQQLEKDIALIERYPHMYVYDVLDDVKQCEQRHFHIVQREEPRCIRPN